MAAAVAAAAVVSGAVSTGEAIAEERQSPLVEDFVYPGADRILDTSGIRLISGDGHILFADCTAPQIGPVRLLHVWTSEEAGQDGQVCFRITAPRGFVTLNVPAVFEIRGDGYATGTGHRVRADLTTPSGRKSAVDVDPNSTTPVGVGASSTREPTTLLRLEALGTAATDSTASPAPAAPTGQASHLVRLTMPDRACSGSLIGPRWVITAAACFPGTPAGGTTASVKVAVGDRSVEAVNLVRREDRDVMLVELATPVTDVAPVSISTASMSPGGSVRAGGFGRTDSEWVPDRPNLAPFTVATVEASVVTMTGMDDKDLCKGDAGGSVLRDSAGGVELVAVAATSWQHGCLSHTDDRRGSTATRVDDIADWIAREIDPTRPRFGPVTVGGLCLEAVDGAAGDGTPVRVADCVAGAARQEFTTAADGTLRVLGKCLDATGVLAGAGRPTRLLACDGGDHQKWELRGDGTVASLVVSPWNQVCLDATTGRSGAAVTTHPCHSGSNQLWRYPARSARFGHLVNGEGACLEVTDPDTSDGSALRAADCVASGYLPDAARQDLTTAPDGTLRLLGRCLDTDTTTVTLHACDGSTAQRWHAHDDHTLTSAGTTRCLDATRGHDVTTTDCQNTATRQWTNRTPAVPTPGADRLQRGEQLTTGQSKTSPDGRYTLILQTNGDLVLYDQAHQPLWHTHTDGTATTRAVLQDDGNLVLYTATGAHTWHTHTNGTNTDRLVLQSDSNLVLYSPDATPHWHRRQ
ncbi:MAG: trypsin-like serine protease [Saccharothrix sp.]|nr:trypsin-like serine protease [Saccharothrix sp.]